MGKIIKLGNPDPEKENIKQLMLLVNKYIKDRKTEAIKKIKSEQLR